MSKNKKDENSSANAYKLSSPTGDMKVENGCSSTNIMGLMLGDNSAPSWQELEALENRRREILKKVELPFYRIIASWNGTCLRALSLDWMVWIPIAMFVAIRIQARTSGNAMPAVFELLGDSDIDILGGFLSFLLVLFVNQTNTRFFEMYSLSKASAGRIQDVAGLASTQLPSAAAHRIVRHLNAAQVAGYVGLEEIYSKQHFFDHFNQKHKLLTKTEMKRIDELDMDSGSAVFKELITWCQRDVGRAKKAGHIDSYEAEELHNKVLAVRAAVDGMYDYCDQPVHFFYIHFLCLLSALYLPLFAAENAINAGWGDEADWSSELISGLFVVLQSIFVVGLRLLGQIMIDPYGDDLEDLSVITYVSTTIENCRIILTAQDQPDVDDALEGQLAAKQQQNEEPAGKYLV